MLLEAYQIYEDSLCKGCGQSAIHSFDPLNSNKFELVDDVVCLGCEAVESESESTVKPAAGTKRYISNHMSE